MHEILLNQDKKQELIKLAMVRGAASSKFVKTDHETWTRMYKIYFRLRDAVEDADEPDIKLSYPYALIEDGVSKITEPIFQRKPPVKTQAKRKDHEDKAAMFASIARQYYSRSEYQLETTESNKEMAITGNSWEIDEWAQRWAVGRRWQKVQKEGILNKLVSNLGRVLPANFKYQYESIEEVETQYPVRVGFHSFYPGVFNVFPEPGVKRVKDMHWLMYQERSVALDDLRQEFRMNAQTGEKEPLYYLDELDEFYGRDRKPGTVLPMEASSLFDSKDYGLEVLNALGVQHDPYDAGADMDKVHLLYTLERDKVWVIANGRFVIGYVDFPYHLPWIPARLKKYTPVPHKLHGMGMLEPVEEEIYQFDDIHTLSFRNWIRLINKMVAYDPDKIVSVDDFKPRAGGKIRVVNTENVGSAIMPIEQSDVVPSMLNMESNIKGLVERSTAIADFSPGTEGTKQTHKTLGGLIEIQNQLAVRFSTIIRLRLADYQDQMFNMEVMFSQFQFDKIPVPFYGPNGEMTMIEANRDSIDTQGVGFDYIIEEDPSFGDDAIARNQAMVLLDIAIKYTGMKIGWVSQGYDPTLLPDYDFNEINRQIAKAFGKSDATSLLKPYQGVIPPEQEFQTIMSGQPLQPNPAGDLIKSYAFHVAKLKSPDYQALRQKGQIPDDINLLYSSFVEQSGALIMQALQQIQQPMIQGPAQLGGVNA